MRVGYAGGSQPNPTYRSMKDHTECFQIDFDPKVISYKDLLDLVWTSHNPCGKAYSRQYRSVILVHDQDQNQLAQTSRDALAKTRGREITTAIEPFKGFTYAEDYHQKYYLRRRPDLARELLAAYPNAKDFADSTVAARLNAALGRNLPKELARRELEAYGLTKGGAAILKRLVGLEQK